MNIHDYLLDQKGENWSKLLSAWHWLLPPAFTLWLVNRFGDLFIVCEDNAVQMLDVGSGTLKVVAASRADFREKIDRPGQADDWLMTTLVDALVASGQLIGPGQCYSYVLVPALGGRYTPENIVIKDLAFHYAAFGPIHERIKDLPDGSEVRFAIEP